VQLLSFAVCVALVAVLATVSLLLLTAPRAARPSGVRRTAATAAAPHNARTTAPPPPLQQQWRPVSPPVAPRDDTVAVFYSRPPAPASGAQLSCVPVLLRTCGA
jgi:hypothetical protein